MESHLQVAMHSEAIVFRKMQGSVAKPVNLRELD
jgi:hypothetical protein